MAPPETAASDPPVALVGAGPGSAGLLTLRAVELLRRADLVLYDKLVPTRLLDFAPASAERVCITELTGCHAHRYQQINHALVQAARTGRRVVRLKGGDPFLFGRGGEEAEALRAAGVAYEVVPGVTAALGAAACAGIPLTHRLHASAVAFVTGHENPAKAHSMLDWPALARFPGTLVFYMGIERLPLIAQALMAHGKAPTTPAAAVEWATTGDQQTVTASLADLPAAVTGEGLTAPAMVVIGSVVDLRPQIAWMEQRPLFGRRLLVTRPRAQAGDLVTRLEGLGATVYTQPTVEIAEPADWGPVDHALGHLSDYHWLVFTSVNGVHATLRRLRHLGRDLRALGGVKLAVIGPATGDALRAYHLEPDLMPESFRSEELAEVLKRRVAGQRILLARADRGREVLIHQLAPLATVDQVAVYAQRDVTAVDPAVLDRLRRGEIDDVLLTSTNVARSLARLLDEPTRERFRTGTVRVVSISPVTSEAIRDLGWPIGLEAAEYTTEGLVAALLVDAAARATVSP